MARESDFMSWIDHQIDTADLKRNVEQYFNEMMIEQKLAALPPSTRHDAALFAKRFGVSQPEADGDYP
jgi:hypothetical protein